MKKILLKFFFQALLTEGTGGVLRGSRVLVIFIDFNFLCEASFAVKVVHLSGCLQFCLLVVHGRTNQSRVK